MGRSVLLRKVDETPTAVIYEVRTHPDDPPVALAIGKGDPLRDADSFATGTEAWAYRRIMALHERDGAWPQHHIHQS